MAASVTYFPDRSFSYAVIYGCPTTSDSRRHLPVMQRISGRLDSAGDTICHPMLIPGIFAEIERERQIALVSKHQTALLRTVTHLSNQLHWKEIPAVRGDNEAAGDANDRQSDEYYMEPWLHVSHLKNGLENWKEQLLKMVEHIDELSATVFLSADETENSPVRLHEEEKFKEKMRDFGRRMKQRLLEIISDYNEQTRACERTMQGMTLATQLVSFYTNPYLVFRSREAC